MAYQASGIMPEQLQQEKTLPYLTTHVWKYFVELHGERANNGMSPNRITSTQIKDWCLVMRTSLELWEVRAIRMLDNAWMESLK